MRDTELTYPAELRSNRPGCRASPARFVAMPVEYSVFGGFQLHWCLGFRIWEVRIRCLGQGSRDLGKCQPSTVVIVAIEAQGLRSNYKPRKGLGFRVSMALALLKIRHPPAAKP